VLVAGDVGESKEVGNYANRLNLPIAIVDKRRDGDDERARATNLIGDVRGKTAILVDDMVDTAGTLTKGAAALAGAGAKKVYGVCTHPVLSGQAIKLIEESAIAEMVVTNTIPLRPEAAACPKIKVVSIAPLLSEAIERIHSETSVSSLFV
jgi:ribose-phosphate pyrophosphokinase